MVEPRPTRLNVVCVKVGTKYGPEYVNNLYAMVARHLDLGTEGNFICFTDDAEGLAEGINPWPIPPYLSDSGWWAKLYLFAPGVFALKDRVVYFDLDTVIVGDLDEICRFEPPKGRLLILRDYYRPEGMQASAMMWRGGFGAEIWQSWARAGRPEIPGKSDQNWIERVVTDPIILQEQFPGSFVSYKVHCQPFPPEDAVVVDFHGEPKPHNCGRSWVEAMWTDSDTGHFHLNVAGNLPLDQIRQQMGFSATLGLPGLEHKSEHGRKVAIVGGGPSVGDPISLASLSRLKHGGGEVWAVNGSYDWLLGRGIVADVHVVIDARLKNIDFLRQTHQETRYYIASQCHWAVFDKLRREKRWVTRLDLETMGDCGTTVGMHAILVAFVEGCREIHLYGFDSSYRGDAGHVYDQAMNAEERIVDVHIESSVYRAAPWMARQTQDFVRISRAVTGAEGSIVVHGDGLLPHMARVLAGGEAKAA